MNIIVFDTETISLGKPYIYNIGYVIADSETGEIKKTRDIVIRQVWNNKPLFSTAYYNNKRPIYTSRMKGRKTIMKSWGDACRIMCADIKEYQVAEGYAYNSRFDESAFYFNHLFYRNKRRPLDNIIVKDIMDYIKVITSTNDYKKFCADNSFLCSNGRVKRTAESLFAYISNNKEYKEEHTALEDSKIELSILLECKKRLGN